MKSRYTKWIPLGNYNHAGKDYIVFVRRCLKTNMLHFKTKTAHNSMSASFGFCDSILPTNLIDVKAAWIKVTE